MGVKYLLIGVVVAIPLVCNSVYNYVNANSTVKVEEKKEISDEFSEENMILYMKEVGIKHIPVVLAQAKLESGHYSSYIFIENNNLFGMKAARIRQTTNIGENRGHALFKSWKDCILDYLYYQQTYLYHADNQEEYLAYLANNYAEDPNYIYKLKDLIE
jgi:uncharacterized FlgJ-related protein